MINPEQLQTIADRISNQCLSESIISALRTEFSGIHFTYCMDDDISGQQPVLECPGFNLYLVDGREHCLCLTQNFTHATGVVVAEIIDD